MDKLHLENPAPSRKQKEAAESDYAARHVSEKFYLDLSMAALIARLAGLGDAETRL